VDQDSQTRSPHPEEHQSVDVSVLNQSGTPQRRRRRPEKLLPRGKTHSEQGFYKLDDKKCAESAEQERHERDSSPNRPCSATISAAEPGRLDRRLACDQRERRSDRRVIR